MLFFIVVWNLMTPGCLVIGLGILQFFCFENYLRDSDHIVLGQWLGLITLILTLLGLSLVLPISFGLGIMTLLLLGSCSLLCSSVRNEMSMLIKTSGREVWLSILALEIGISALINRPMIWYDTGSYHMGMMHWLNQFGVVPGVALINGSFGFTSAWFAFSAPFVSERFGDNIGASTNGFVLLLAAITIILLSRQICSQSAQLSDYFGCCFFSITAIAYGVTVFTGAPILVSFSADVIITFLIGVTAWIMLIIQQQTKYDFPALSSPIQSSERLDIRIIILLLAGAAFSIKLSAIPIVVISLLFYSKNRKRFVFRRLLTGFSIFGVMIVPMLTFGIITSGCPLYPTQLLCVDLPWTLSAAQSSDALKPIAVLKGNNRLPNLWDIQDWIWLLSKRVQLFLISAETRGMVVLAFVSFLIFCFLLIQFKRRQAQGQIWILSLGFFGSLFILGTSPLIRFGLGYFALIPSLALAMAIVQLLNQDIAVVKDLYTQKPTVMRFGVLMGLLVAGWGGAVMVSAGTQSRFFMPPSLPVVTVTSVSINDIAYGYPDNYQFRCWSAPIPCSPLPITENIFLRKPKAGIGGGFQRLPTTIAKQ